MIRHPEQQSLFIDFSHLLVDRGAPSDVDMIYMLRDGFTIIGEIKSIKGEFTRGQRTLLTAFCDNIKAGAILIYITHDKDTNRGDTSVDVAECKVQEYYLNGQWHTPQGYTSVQTAVAKIIELRRKNGI